MSEVHASAKKGIKLLMGRQVLLQVFTFGGGVLLARVLTPAQFGIYGIATFLVGMLAMAGDFGLAPSFIQRKEDLTDLDLRVGFTLQQVFTTIIVVLLLVLAPWLTHFYPKAPPETVWLVRALAFNLYLTSWRSMSALRLERHLQYDRLAVIEVVETLVYQGMAVILAVMGYGVWSFVWATMVRGLLGTVLVFCASPWSVRFAYNQQIAKDILKFGIPFQLQGICNSAGGWVTPMLVGSMIGPQAVGFLTWASSNGKKPLILVDNVMRVSFPHFSRIQDDQTEVERLLLRYVTFLLLPSGLWFSVIFVSGHALVHVIYTDKWVPAVPALVLFAMALQADVISFALTVALNAVGKVGFVSQVYAYRTIANVLFSVPLVFVIGFNAVPLVYTLVIATANIWLASGFGWSMTRRMAVQLPWLFCPVVVSILVGESALRLSQVPTLQAITGSLAVTVMYGLTAVMIGPAWLKELMRKKFRHQIAAFGRKPISLAE